MTPLLVHLAGARSGRACGAEYGGASWFTAQITCPTCLVTLDGAIEAGFCEVVDAGHVYVLWKNWSPIDFQKLRAQKLEDLMALSRGLRAAGFPRRG